jgi:6-phosphogluconolactonase
MMRRRRLQVFADAEELAQRAAAWLCALALESRQHFAVCLSGGSTPKRLYQLLAGPEFIDRFPWSRVHWFWGDERFVPPDDKLSNYRMVRDAMLSRAPVPEANIHAVPTDGLTPAEAAVAYERDLKLFYGAETLDPTRPLFDVTLLGLGEDGHTASLFPGTPVLEERRRWVAAVLKVKPEARITLTYPALESSRHVAFLTAGADKRQIFGRVLKDPEHYPAGRLHPEGELIWFADRAASPDESEAEGHTSDGARDDRKKAAAQRAVNEVADGMVVGLGTGSTASHALTALAERIKAGLRITGIPTSEATAAMARDLGIPLGNLAGDVRPDLTIDGADEVERGSLALIKGHGGALLREKIVASASKRVIIIVDDSKLVDRLGSAAPVPVEIVRFGWEVTRRRLGELGATVALRLAPDGAPFVTDGGNYLIDCTFGAIGDLHGLANRLAATVGVVENGLFLDIAHQVMVAGRDGVKILSRE